LQQKSRALDQKDAELARLQEQLDLQRRKTDALAARAKAIRERQGDTEKALRQAKDISPEVKRRIREDLYGLAAEVEHAA
jgi:septal ring factor EnvC (AmiA/AmiB activator)